MALSQNRQMVYWPADWNKIYIISIRDARWEQAQQRMHWIPRPLTRVQGTMGTRVDKDWWFKRNYLRNMKLRRGEIGCYDSHRRVWQDMVDHEIPLGVIFEDDADIQEIHMSTIQKAYQDLNRINPHWDVFYLSRNRKVTRVSRKITSVLAIPDRQTVGAFAYVITLAAAHKLLQYGLPIEIPLDHFLFAQMQDKLHMYCVEPNLFHVVPVFSDTSFIF
jgi:GR25 family glycosyltransferase involved in LPS biosynthesis